MNRYSFPLDTPLTVELAELLGAFIGDGFTNKYNRTGMTQFTGDASKDKDYFKHLRKLIKTLFPSANPRMRVVDNTLRLILYSKELFELLTIRFDFPAGKKCYTVQIPDEIMNTSFELQNACLRGIFDTDGGIIIDKRKIYKKPYVRIHLRMMSPRLIEQIHSLLLARGINSRISDQNTRIQLNGTAMKEFLRQIGFNNLRHKQKIGH